MGRRYKKPGAAAFRELRAARVLSSRKGVGVCAASFPGEKSRMEPALPPLAAAKLSCRQLGSFRGRIIFESGLTLLHLH
jgi:hypothetical protein